MRGIVGERAVILALERPDVAGRRRQNVVGNGEARVHRGLEGQDLPAGDRDVAVDAVGVIAPADVVSGIRLDRALERFRLELGVLGTDDQIEGVLNERLQAGVVGIDQRLGQGQRGDRVLVHAARCQPAAQTRRLLGTLGIIRAGLVGRLQVIDSQLDVGRVIVRDALAADEGHERKAGDARVGPPRPVSVLLLFLGQPLEGLDQGLLDFAGRGRRLERFAGVDGIFAAALALPRQGDLQVIGPRLDPHPDDLAARTGFAPDGPCDLSLTIASFWP